jgi:6-phosphofructokinase 1
MKTLGILTAGGDAPGMNAVIRAATKTALAKGARMLGIRRGFEGLITDDIFELNRDLISNIVQRGGSIVHSARNEEFRTKEGRAKALKTCERRGIDGIIMLGGDGTTKGALAFEKDGGPPAIVVPCTIDNDIAGLDTTIGFDTAVNAALEAIDRIRDTAETMERTFFIETMGRESGAIAVASGIAGGANVVIIPEKRTNIEAVARRIMDDRKAGAKSLLIVVSEGDDAGGAYAIAEKVGKLTAIDSRVSVLGYMQRGGNPSARDRIVATVLGVAAVEELLKGKHGYVVGWKCESIMRIPFGEAHTARLCLPPDIARHAGTILA